MGLREVLLTASLVCLTACGGGSGGDSGGNGNGPVVAGPPPLTITTDNATATAAHVTKAMDVAATLGDSGVGFTAVVGAVVDTPAASVISVAVDMAAAAEEHVQQLAGLGAVGVVVEDTQPCPAGGETTIQIDTGSLSEVEFSAALAEGSIPSGTSVSLAFADCADPEQPTVDGGVTIVFEQFPTDVELGTDAFEMQFSADFDNLQTGDQLVDGDLNVVATSTAGRVDIQVTGSNLQAVDSVSSVTLVDYSISVIEDNVATIVTLTFTLNASALAGEVEVTTQSALVTDFAAGNPRTGVIVVTGAGGSSLTLTVLDPVNVQLDVDEDGDGNPEQTLITTWAELAAAA